MAFAMPMGFFFCLRVVCSGLESQGPKHNIRLRGIYIGPVSSATKKKNKTHGNYADVISDRQTSVSGPKGTHKNVDYRGTSLRRNSPLPWDHHRALYRTLL